MHTWERVRALILCSVAWVNQETKTSVWVSPLAVPPSILCPRQCTGKQHHPTANDPGCPSPTAILSSLPVCLNVSLSCVHSKPGPISWLFCFFCLTRESELQTTFTHPSPSAAWCLGACQGHAQTWKGPPYLCIPCSKWDTLVHLRLDMLIHSGMQNTLAYPAFLQPPFFYV